MRGPSGKRPGLVLIMTSALAVATTSTVASGAGVPPTLLPGGTAVVVGTHISCQVTARSVRCGKSGGLTATLDADNTLRVFKSTQRIASSSKPMKLGTNGGFVIIGRDANGVYCHVYVEGARTLSCAVNGGSSAGARGFDMSESRVVTFRYDKNGIRHDLRSIPQP